jgi:hypothetical protein
MIRVGDTCRARDTTRNLRMQAVRCDARVKGNGYANCPRVASNPPTSASPIAQPGWRWRFARKGRKSGVPASTLSTGIDGKDVMSKWLPAAFAAAPSTAKMTLAAERAALYSSVTQPSDAVLTFLMYL